MTATFHASSGPVPSTSRQLDGPRRVLITDDFLFLPCEVSVMIDDPVVSKFLQG